MDKAPTKAQITKILQTHFPKSKVLAIQRITKGYTHFMYNCKLSDKSVIVRIGDNPGKDSIAKELWVMKQYTTIQIPIPRIYGYNISRKLFPFDYMVMEKLPGRELDVVWRKMTEEERRDIAVKMGALLAKLHNISFAKFGSLGPEGVIEERRFKFRGSKKIKKKTQWQKIILPKTLEHLAQVIITGLFTVNESAKILHYLHKNINFIDSSEPVLIHNDFVLGHIFVDKINGQWQITGLCDVEFASAYPREFDFLKLAREGLLPKYQKEILQGYGKKLNNNFNKVVHYYLVCRNLGYAHHLINAGNPKAKEIVQKIKSMVK